MIDAFKVSPMMKEIKARLMHVTSNDGPTFLDKSIVKAIRTRSFITTEIKNDSVNLFCRERATQNFKVIMPFDKGMKVKLHISVNRKTQPSSELIPE
jgi:predicted ATPase